MITIREDFDVILSHSYEKVILLLKYLLVDEHCTDAIKRNELRSQLGQGIFLCSALCPFCIGSTCSRKKEHSESSIFINKILNQSNKVKEM